MVNVKKYDDSNPRVFISTRLKTKEKLNSLYTNLNTMHKKLEKLLKDNNERKKI